MNDVVASARYGIELVDALTGGPLIGGCHVEPTPDDGSVVRYQAVPSRWVFEKLDAGSATFALRADHYVPRSFVAGSGPSADGPPVPGPSDPGLLQRAEMTPRSGYPFPATLTRVISLVRYQLAPDVFPAIAASATVSIMPRYRIISPPATWTGPAVSTRTTNDGQYTMWFVPSVDPPAGYERLPFECDVHIVFVPPEGGPALTADITSLAVATSRTTEWPVVTLTP